LDRRALAKPGLSSLLSSLKSMANDEQQRTEIERQVATIWCHLLHLQSIPLATISLFKLGGNSLVLMKIYHAYETQFQQSLDIRDLFRRATIADHARLLEAHQKHPTVESKWHSLNVIEGKSCACFYKEQFQWWCGCFVCVFSC
jgi:acyl carrier protein